LPILIIVVVRGFQFLQLFALAGLLLLQTMTLGRYRGQLLI